jgi:hypothetical protein
VVWNNLLVTRPVISACSISLVSFFLSLPSTVAFSFRLLLFLPGTTSSDYLGGFSLGGSTYSTEHLFQRLTRLVTSHWLAVCLSPSFFARSPLLFFLSLSACAALLSSPDTVSLSFLFRFIYNAADRNYSSLSSPCLCPRLHWYPLPPVCSAD